MYWDKKEIMKMKEYYIMNTICVLWDNPTLLPHLQIPKIGEAFVCGKCTPHGLIYLLSMCCIKLNICMLYACHIYAIWNIPHFSHILWQIILIYTHTHIYVIGELINII